MLRVPRRGHFEDRLLTCASELRSRFWFARVPEVVDSLGRARERVGLNHSLAIITSSVRRGVLPLHGLDMDAERHGGRTLVHWTAWLRVC